MRLQSSDPIFACHNTLPATKMTRMIVMSRVTEMLMMTILTTTVTEMLLCFLSFPPPTGFDKSAEPSLIKVINGAEKKSGYKKVFNSSLDLLLLKHTKNKFLDHLQIV